VLLPLPFSPLADVLGFTTLPAGFLTTLAAMEHPGTGRSARRHASLGLARRRSAAHGRDEAPMGSGRGALELAVAVFGVGVVGLAGRSVVSQVAGGDTGRLAQDAHVPIRHRGLPPAQARGARPRRPRAGLHATGRDRQADTRHSVLR
jgi:hypothetical protein